METSNKIDALDEALRVIYLESAKEADITKSERELGFVMAEPNTIQINADKKKLLLEKLNVVFTSLSFGQLLQDHITKINVDDGIIAEKSNLSVGVITDLKNDAIYTNNIPIVLLTKLLAFLNIPFIAAEKTIYKTFDMLQTQSVFNNSAASNLNPAFRKGAYTSRENLSKNSPKNDDKTLFENKESLEKYLARLNELMNK